MKASVLVAGIVLLAGSIGSVYAAQYLTGDFPKSRGYSPAVITKGGRTVWLAGEGGYQGRGRQRHFEQPRSTDKISF
jgi:hypothetical protein